MKLLILQIHIFLDFSNPLITFNKELGGALLLPHHTAVRSIVRQRAVVDGEVAHVANTLKYVPESRARGFLNTYHTTYCLSGNFCSCFIDTHLLEKSRNNTVGVLWNMKEKRDKTEKMRNFNNSTWEFQVFVEFTTMYRHSTFIGDEVDSDLPVGWISCPFFSHFTSTSELATSTASLIFCPFFTW